MTSNLENEILEQPAAMQQLIENEFEHIKSLSAQLAGKFQYILIAARGTSDNAARYAQYLFQIVNKIPVMLATPSVFSLYKQTPNLEGALVIAISQSGQSPDIVSVVTAAHRQSRPTIAITNDPTSPLAKAADHTIQLSAGIEKAVAATKTYTTSLGTIAMLSTAFYQDQAMAAAVVNLPTWIQKTLDLNLNAVSRMERYRFMEYGVVIGRGYNYATAFEIALKVKELTGVTTVPYSSADFLHGPIATLKSGYPVISITHSGVMYPDMMDINKRVKSLGADLLIISDSQDARYLGNMALPIPEEIPEWLSPIVNVLPGQILGWQIALAKGLNPDEPKGLSKVTETL